jgi:glucose-6-phosphate 1-dehydrogenase
MVGNSILFQRAEFVEQGWRMVQPLLEAWQNPPDGGFPNYAAGSAGPQAADDLLASSGHAWHLLEKS